MTPSAGSQVSFETPCPTCGTKKEETRELFEEALVALELCLECEGLSWEAEHEAEAVCNKLRRYGAKRRRKARPARGEAG